MRIAGSTKVIGYVGATYRHSHVYDLYNFVFSELGLDYVYVPFHVKNIESATSAITSLGIHAVGVTMPFKVSIIPHLESVDDCARRSGAVNVVTNIDGELVGRNTDGLGALRALREVVDIGAKYVLLIGSGGSARAIAAALTGTEARVCIVSVCTEQASIVANHTGCEWQNWSERNRLAAQADIIINATPVGMEGTSMEEEAAVRVDVFHPNQVVMDVVISPKSTPLLKGAASRGCSTVCGERMLLWQALLKFEIYTGQPVDLKLMELALHHRKNLG